MSWTIRGTSRIEVRVGAPDGGLLTTAGVEGKAETGDWVTPGTVFYLQDAAPGVPRDAENTLARLVVTETIDGPCS